LKKQIFPPTGKHLFGLPEAQQHVVHSYDDEHWLFSPILPLGLQTKGAGDIVGSNVLSGERVGDTVGDLVGHTVFAQLPKHTPHVTYCSK
jgi:hypothetical protein